MSKELDVQGHRGCRGVMPENTLEAFTYAIKEYDVTTLELDLCVSKDLELVVSHEPFFNHEIASLDGVRIEESKQLQHNLYSMDYEQIKNYDVGSVTHPKFPDQENMPAIKPLLRDVVAVAEKLNPDIQYNIEIKRKPKMDEYYHPKYDQFADLVVREVDRLGIKSRTVIQCFDIETLRYLHEHYKSYTLSYLVEYGDDAKGNFEKLGFLTAVYSPYYKILTSADIAYCHDHDITVIPWTLNDKKDIKKYIDMGVDGIISDFPGRVNQVIEEL